MMSRHDVLVGTCLAALMSLAACVPHLEPVEPISTDRPDQTESTTLVPAGMVQVEGGATVSRSGAQHSTSIGEALVRIGVRPSLELRIEPLSVTRIGSSGARSYSGMEDLAVGLKTPLYRRSTAAMPLVPDVSLLVATTLPTGAAAIGASGAEPEAKLAAQWGIGTRAGLASNLTLRRGREAGEGYWERGLTASLGFDFTNRAGSYLEWYAIRDSRSVVATQVINGGVTYRLTGDLQIDARVGSALRERGRFAGVGVARRW